MYLYKKIEKCKQVLGFFFRIERFIIAFKCNASNSKLTVARRAGQIIFLALEIPSAGKQLIATTQINTV